ncbi:MAG: response regulator [Polyangiaceae bacterium]|nr:response regulator [Polyangiaceae bacterium]
MTRSSVLPPQQLGAARRSYFPHDPPASSRDRSSTPTTPRSGETAKDPLGRRDRPSGPGAGRPQDPPPAREPPPSRPGHRETYRSDEGSGSGHDPYTPIHQILGYTRLLVGALQGNVAQQHIDDLRNIENAARRLLGVVQAMEGGEEELPPSTRVSIMPRTEEPAPPASATPAAGAVTVAGAAPAAEPEGAGLASILVVDDSRGNRDVLCRVLRENGYRTTTAEDGTRALGLTARERFDAVLLDVNMPGMSGLGVLSALRQTRSAAELPVIMVTTRGASEDVVDSLKLGANDHVSKPINFDVLLGRLETQLTLKRSREQLSQLASELAIRSEFIRKTFGRYLSEDVVARLLSSPEAQMLGGEEREVTILMTDLRSFTTMTEHMPPELVMRLLNGYLGEMARIIMARGGTIVEFIGDAIFALFGAPFAAEDDARRAVACALEMQIAMDAVNDRNLKEGLPMLQMGIALNTGPVVVGNIGSEARTKYGVVGAQVNLTSRIESCTVGRQILISESTRRAAGAGLVLGVAQALPVKGFQSRVLVHELLGLDGPERLSLPERRIDIVQLSTPISVSCARLVGKRVDGERLTAELIGLSPSGATMRTRPRPAPFTNLHIHLPAPLAARLGGDLFAKVLDLDLRSDDVLRVCFTSSPPGLPALVQELCGAAK